MSEGSLEEWEAWLWLEGTAGFAGGEVAEWGALRRGVVWAWVAARGGAAAALGVACMPEGAEPLVATTTAERVASRRNAAAHEAAPALPRDGDALAALAGEGGGALAASLSFIAAGYPSLAAPDHAPTPGCDPAVVAAMAGWSAHDGAAWPRVRDGLYAAFETGMVPRHVVRRAAVHWYLATRSDALQALASLAGERTYVAPREAAALRAMAAGAEGDPAAMAAALAGADWEDDPYLVWVRAEGERMSGNHNAAVALADDALRADPFFVAAYLTRASALLAEGRPQDALSDLGFLQRAFGDDPTYRRWIDAMNLALR